MAPDESALLVPIPAAEAAVGVHRAKLDLSAREGVPAHITVLYPFLPVGELTDGVLESVRVLMAGIEAFDFTLDRVSWFGSDVVWLGPRDPAPFRSLTEKAFAAFPACPPYGGQYADVVPHLTVGDLGGEDALRLAAAEVSGHLPIATQATEVILMTGPAARPGARPGGPARSVAHRGHLPPRASRTPAGQCGRSNLTCYRLLNRQSAGTGPEAQSALTVLRSRTPPSRWKAGEAACEKRVRSGCY